MERLGPYQLVRQIAMGGMAEVWLAKTVGIAGFEKYVALKMIHPNYIEDGEFIDMLVDEAKLAVQLSHPNIAQTFDLGRVDDTYYITMEYIDGTDLFKLLRATEARDVMLPFEACAYLMKEVAAALDHAHSRVDHDGKSLGIVHRDVSPQNVMITYDGVVKLVDFGIAKASKQIRRTEVGIIKGKYYYLSPEQAYGESLDGRSDIYAAGIVLYEMITGRPIYIEEDLTKLLDLAREGAVVPPSKLRPDTPPQLERIVMQALAPETDRRYQTAGELAIDLQLFLRAYAPRYVTADVAALMEELVKRAPPPAPVPEPDPADSHLGTNRHLRAEEVAHAGDELLDANSVITNATPVATAPDTDQTDRGESLSRDTPPRFGRFELHEKLGGGRIATVHRASFETRGEIREVALKRFLPELSEYGAFGTNFVSELTAARQLEHPNIVALYEMGCTGGIYYAASELVRGSVLGAAMKRAYPAAPRVALAIVDELLAAVGYAWDGLDDAGGQLRCVHGDLTPANVMITSTGQVKVTDFGISSLTAPTATSTRHRLGYRAPEMKPGMRGDGRTSIYAVGVIAWELLTGTRLANPRDLIAPSKHNRRCKAELDRIVMRAVASQPNDRWPSAAAMREALDDMAETQRNNSRDVAEWVGAYTRGDTGRNDRRPKRPISIGDEPDIRISIEDGSKQIDIGTYLEDSPKRRAAIPSRELLDDVSKEMSITQITLPGDDLDDES